MFERLPTVPRSQELLDKAFRRASKAGTTPGNEDAMVKIAGNILSDNLANLIRKFPSFENLPPFYREMADVTVGIDKVRISLSRLQWASNQTREITREYLSRMNKGGSRVAIRREAFGRMSSVINSIEKDLDFLGAVRNVLRDIPSINPDIPTILIAGYPNVGKSSFIVDVTGARPEIASYPFTTKGIYVGHFTKDGESYQVVDTPGLLDRPLSHRNDIERQALAALRYLKGVVLFILDPSEHSGYPLDSQLKLAEDVKSWVKLPILVVANKADIMEYRGVLNISTLTGRGVSEVLDKLVDLLSSNSTSSAL
jgi:nucleolar GTP-binding protein